MPLLLESNWEFPFTTLKFTMWGNKEGQYITCSLSLPGKQKDSTVLCLSWLQAACHCYALLPRCSRSGASGKKQACPWEAQWNKVLDTIHNLLDAAYENVELGLWNKSFFFCNIFMSNWLKLFNVLIVLTDFCFSYIQIHTGIFCQVRNTDTWWNSTSRTWPDSHSCQQV